MAPAAKSTASEGRSPNLQLQQLKIRRDGGNACSTTRGIDRRWAIGSIQCTIRIMEQIAHGQPAVLNFPLEHARFDLRTQNPMPPSAGPGDPCMAPQFAPRGACSNAQQRRFRPQAPDRSRSQESTRIGIRSSKSSPPTSWAGSLLWLLRRAAGNPLAASAALRNQTVSGLFAAGQGSRCCALLTPWSHSSAMQRA